MYAKLLTEIRLQMITFKMKPSFLLWLFPNSSAIMTCFSGVCVGEMRTTLAPMLVCPLPSQGMDAETGICGGAKGTELAWAMFV